MSKEAMKLALEAAYLAGFNASGEGYNAEYPFGDHARNPEEDAAWIKDRDNALRKTLAERCVCGEPDTPGTHRTDGPCLAEQPAQQEPVAWMYQCSADSSGPVLMQNKRDWAESSGGLWTETPLYKSPPAQLAREPLTDDEIQECWYKTQGDAELFARAIESKLKEKTT